ncbi:MAG: EAL domain-containing protein [Betaproteobacteria bacterium]
MLIKRVPRARLAPNAQVGALGVETMPERTRMPGKVPVTDVSLMDLEKREALFRYVVDAAPDGVVCVDSEGRIVLVNPMIETIFGYASGELIGKKLDMLWADRQLPSDRELRQESGAATQSHPMGAVAGLTGRRKNGEVFPVDVGIGGPAGGQEGFSVAFVRDTTERTQYEGHLLHQSTHDELTGLPNRSLFQDRIRHAIAGARQDGNRVAVLMLDLDKFKAINDTFGDAFGDELLVEIARRLKDLLGKEDTLARLGGDEFGILLSTLDRAEAAGQVAQQVLTDFAVPCLVNSQVVIVGGSLGMSFFPDDAVDGPTILRHADVAMYHAKQSGRGIHVAFSESMDRKLQEELRMHVRLKHAIDVGGLALHYQPQVDTQTGKIVGSEALLRWRDDELGDVSPARFIPVAEATGLILPIGEWVIETACRQIAMWARDGKPVKVAVNLSAHQLRDRKLAGKIRQVLQTSGAPPELLEIEITESAAMGSLVLAQQILGELSALGIGVALDDFGTGYSSFGSLQSLPITKLKIDQSFVRNLPGDDNDASLVRTIIGLGRSLNLTLVAEGVETDEQRVFLHHAGCETYQGWLFSKAVSAMDMGKLLRTSVAGESNRTATAGA